MAPSNLGKRSPLTLLAHLVCLMIIISICSARSSLALEQQQQSERLKLGVYIESLCPDSKRFFLRQLVPTYRSIGQLFEPQIVPFGHARVLTNNRMICQHGSRECEGNRRMACIQARANGTSQQVETIGCLFEGQMSPRDCLAKHMPMVSFDQVERCTGSDESYRMMQENEKLTGKVGYIPHLTLDGKSDGSIQDEAENDLKNFICKNYKGGDKPEACQ